MNRRFFKAPDGAIIFDELSLECQACLKIDDEQIRACPIDKRKARTKGHQDVNGHTFFCSKKLGFVESSKLFFRMFETLPSILQYLADSKRDMLNELENSRREINAEYSAAFRRLVHNLESHNAHIIQEIGALVPEADLMQNKKRTVDVVTQVLRSQPAVASRALLTIFQIAIGTKHEMTIYRQLNGAGVSLDKRRHRAHKIIMNSVCKFFPDFSDRHIEIEIAPTDLEVFVDFDSLSVSLHHIMENAIKYAMPHSTISISFQRQRDLKFIDVIIEMKSLLITSEDMSHIFKKEYSGEHARKNNLSGSGYGMAVVWKLLNLNGSKISLIPNADRKGAVAYNGLPYETNKFIISIPFN